MIYQKLLIGDTPYQLTTGTMTTPFEIHRHSEIELIYCFKGSFKIRIDNTDYMVNSGSKIKLRAPLSPKTQRAFGRNCKYL